MTKAATIYSIITTLAVLAAVIAGGAWGIGAIRHRATGTAKTVFITAAIAAIVALFLFVRTYDPSLAQKPTEDADPPAASLTPAEETAAPTEPEETEKPAETPEPSQTAGPEWTEGEPPAVGNNPLVLVPLSTHPVMNGAGTERIGTWASITVTKEYIASIDDIHLHAYLGELGAEGFNWFNIFFDDGTGLYCMGADYIEYGTVDPETGGAVEYIDEPAKSIHIFDEDHYSNEH